MNKIIKTYLNFWVTTFLIFNQLPATSSLSLPRFVYRTIQRNSIEHRNLLKGESLLPRNRHSTASVRDHVLTGSSSKMNGSCYISTTRNLETAIKFAAPFNPIVRVNVTKLVEKGGSVIDLSNEDSFKIQVPPGEGESLSEEERTANIKRKIRLTSWAQTDEIFPDPSDQDFMLKDQEYLMSLAAMTPWENTQLYATRSQEVLLEGEVPSCCFDFLHYDVKTSEVSNFPWGEPIPIKDIICDMEPLEKVGGSNDGLTKCKIKNTSDTDVFILKQAKPNINPNVLPAQDMRYSIDAEFASFATYRMFEWFAPSLDIHVRDCAKVDFFASYIDENWSALGTKIDVSIDLNCLVFRDLKEPVKQAPVSWTMVPFVCLEASPFLDTVLESLSTDAIINKDQAIARMKSNVTGGPRCSAEDIQAIESKIFGRQFVFRRLETQYALRLVKGIAVDIMLGNIYCWGLGDKSNCVLEEKTGKLYRMSAESALGSCGLEHLNYRNRDAKLFLDFLFGTHTSFFPSLIASDTDEKRKQMKKQLHLENKYLLANINNVMGLITAVIFDRGHEVEDLFTSLSMIPDQRRICEMYPERKPRIERYFEFLWERYLLKRSTYLYYLTNGPRAILDKHNHLKYSKERITLSKFTNNPTVY